MCAIFVLKKIEIRFQFGNDVGPSPFPSSQPMLRTPFPDFRYHAHQESGIRWMIGREAEDATVCCGGILADEMGLGKTWTTIGLLLNNPVPETLILAPPVLLPQWREALVQSGIRVRQFAERSAGPLFQPHPPSAAGEVRVTLATYDRTSRLVERLRDEVHFDRIICDEGHVLRNGRSTTRFTALVQLRAPCRWILSGTPIQNSKRDFKNLLEWLNPEDTPADDYTKLAEEIMLRRVVSDVRQAVADFPENPPVHHVHAVEMPAGSEEKDIFDRLVLRFKDALEVRAKSWIVLELYLRIRQFLAHPLVYVDAMKRKYGEEYQRNGWTATATKMDTFDRLLKELPQEPTIVFGNFTKELDIAAETMKANGYRVLHIRGGMNDAVRGYVLHTARQWAAAGVPVGILVQIVSGNAGLNMQYCSRVVFLSSHWNPSVVDQAVARAYRMGQRSRVEVHHILVADGAQKNLDRLIIRSHLKKRELTREIFASLVPDSALDAEYVIGVLNQVCPDEEAEETVAAKDDVHDIDAISHK